MATFRIYSYSRSSRETSVLEFGYFPKAAIEADRLSKDPDTLFVTLGEMKRDPKSGEQVFRPIGESLWKDTESEGDHR